MVNRPIQRESSKNSNNGSTPNISNTPRNLHMPTTHTFRKRHMAR